MKISEYRVCRRCEESLPLTLEYFYRNGEKNYQYYCKKCQAIMKKEWAIRNKDKVNTYAAKRRTQRTPEQVQMAKEYMRCYHEEHKEEHNARCRINYSNNTERAREYKRNNRERINSFKRKYEKEKRQNDKLYFVKQKARSVIYKSFSRKGFQKTSLAEEITGVNSTYLCDYLLGTYKDVYGCEWDGEEKVHIDHIIPLSTAKTEDDVKELCYYKNLRLIKAADNLGKSNKLDYEIGGNQNGNQKR